MEKEAEHVESEVEEEEEPADWADWDADDSGDGNSDDPAPTLCLFCEQTFPSPSAALSHCAAEHSFDLTKIRSEGGLGFYDTMKLINYIRTQVSNLHCPNCTETFSSRTSLLSHLSSSAHFAPPQTSPPPWTPDSFLTPFLSEDPILYTLEDNDDSNVMEGETTDAVSELMAKANLSSELPDPGYDADVSTHGGKKKGDKKGKGVKFASDEDDNSDVAGSEDLQKLDEITALRIENEDLRAEIAAMKIAEAENENLKAELAALKGRSTLVTPEQEPHPRPVRTGVRLPPRDPSGVATPQRTPLREGILGTAMGSPHPNRISPGSSTASTPLPIRAGHSKDSARESLLGSAMGSPHPNKLSSKKPEEDEFSSEDLNSPPPKRKLENSLPEEEDILLSDESPTKRDLAAASGGVGNLEGGEGETSGRRDSEGLETPPSGEVTPTGVKPLSALRKGKGGRRVGFTGLHVKFAEGVPPLLS